DNKSFNELSHLIGNGVNATVKMIGRYRGRVLPAPRAHEQIDRDLVSLGGNSVRELEQSYANLELQRCATLPIELARATNGYLDATAPFSLAKDPAKSDRLDTVLNFSAQMIHRALV